MKMDTQVSFRTTKDTKNKAMEIYDNLGVDLTTAINVFLRKSIEYRGFPFEVREETPNKKTQEAMINAYNDKGSSKTFDTVDELMEYLNA